MRFKIIALLVICFGVIAGFGISDPWGSRTNNQTDNVPAINYPVYHTDGTVIYVDSLNGTNDTTALKARGYKPYYRGTGPQGATATWYQGVSTVFAAYNGPTTGYVAANYNVVTGVNNIDSWLVFPRVTGGLQAGDSLYFYSRSATGSTYPDSIRVMYSANDSVPEGTWTELGRFKTNTTTGWELRGFRAPTASANGRFAIRYCVANGGPSGSNSDYIGIDMMYIVRTSTTPPPTWTQQTSPVTVALYSVCAVDNNVAWACGNTGKVVRTINSGVNWTNVSGNIPTSSPLYAIYGLNSNVAICAGDPSSGAFIYVTTNGGTNWTQTYNQTGGFIDAVWMDDANTVYAMGDPVSAVWTLIKSTNGGFNWTTLPTLAQAGSEAGWNNAFFKTGNNIWFGTNNTRIYYSSNSGNNWVVQATTGEVNSYAVWFNTPLIGLMGGATVMSTTNGGTLWTAMTVPGTGNMAGITGTGSEWWVARQGASIYYSANNGGSWTTQYTATGQTFYHINASRTGNTVWAVTSTGTIHRYGTPLAISAPVTNVADNYTLGQNYPNPFNPTTTINFSIPKSGFVTLKVYDLLGKEVATLVNEVVNTGTYNIDFNGANLSSGVYFYKLQSGDFTSVKRMMLVK